MEFHKKLFLLPFLALFIAITAFASLDARGEDKNNPYEMGAQKASIPPETLNKAQNIIKKQLAAISDRDAEAAFDFMTPPAHENFETAGDFLSDMRFEYGPIYNHMDIKFLGHFENGATTIQKVSLKDRYSAESVTVIYKLKLQDDGQWLIDSFTLLDFGEAQPI